MDQTNVGNMNGYYERQYSSEELQRLTEMHNHDAMMGILNSNGMDSSDMMDGGQTLDDIIIQNNKEMQQELNRRRSFHHSHSYAGANRAIQDQDSRRSSMLEFGSQSNRDPRGIPIRSVPSTA